MAAPSSCILVVDIGSSGVRCSVYKDTFLVQGTLARRPAKLAADGTVDPVAIVDNVNAAVTECLAHVKGAIDAVGFATMAGTWLGVNNEGVPVTPVYTYAYSGAAACAEDLRTSLSDSGTLDNMYKRSGVPIHSAYVPAQLLKLKQSIPGIFESVTSWRTLVSHVLCEWCQLSHVPVSFSEASWTGLLDRKEMCWNEELLAKVGANKGSFPPLTDLCCIGGGGLQQDAGIQLSPKYREVWAAIADARLFPGVGDGAAANFGAGCIDSSKVCVTIGTSAAARIVCSATTTEGEVVSVPKGLWAYSVNKEQCLLGGALTDGGRIYEWFSSRFAPPSSTALDGDVAALAPDAHGLTILPFPGGERATGWNDSATMTIAGLTHSTTTAHMVRAAMEAVMFRIAEVVDRLCVGAGVPEGAPVVLCGGAVRQNRLWASIATSVLNRRVIVSPEEECTSKGVAVLLTTFGPFGGALQPDGEEVFDPEPASVAVYALARRRQARLYSTVPAL